MNKITQSNLILRKHLTINLFFLVLFGFCLNSAGQSIQGSFESKFKRYVKGESYLGITALVRNEVAWKGERVYAQMVLWSALSQSDLTYEVSDFTDGSNIIPSSNLTLLFSKDVKADSKARACGGYPSQRADVVEIADALSFSPQTTLDATNPTKIWLRLDIPTNTSIGNYSGFIKVKQSGVEKINFNLNIEVLDKVLPDRVNWNFHLDLWQYPYQILKHYNNDHSGNEITIWSDDHFNMFQPYYELLADAGQKVISTHIKEGGQGQPSMIKWTLKTNGTWEYDFTAFDKYVDLLTSLGISKQINCFSPVGWNGDLIPYYDEATGTKKELSTTVASTIYNTRWDHFLSAFKVHLDSKGWFDKSVLFLDEIHNSLLLDVIDMIKSNNVNWKIGLSFFDLPSQEINDAIYDMSGNLGTASSVGRTDKISTFYTSCAQTIPNNYVTPENSPSEMNWMAWHAANQNLTGYLRWALDYWTLSDPLDARDGTNTAGDNSLIYRSSNELTGEVYSSYQLEHLRNGIQDFEKIQLLKAELEGSTDPIDQEALQTLNDKIAQFGTTSGLGADALVSQGETILNDIVKGTFTYCRVSGETTTTAYTQRVNSTEASENINYFTGSYPSGYSRYESGQIGAIIGSRFSLTVENSSGSNCARTKVWIDWNNDDDFDDAGEEILNAGIDASCSNATSNTFNVTVPINAFVGLSRMRVQVRDANDSEPIACGVVSNSSTTDFNIRVLDTYCSSKTNYNQIYYLKKLLTNSCNGSIDFETTYAPLKGYKHHVQTSATVNRNSSFNIDLENSVSSRCARTKIWVDWNHDNDFSDVGEEIFSSGIENSCANLLKYNLVATVPSNAVLGTTRMRVQVRDSYIILPDACIIDAVTGTTDFDIEIIDNTSLACSPIILSPSNSENFINTSATISWSDNNTVVDNWRLEVTSKDFIGATIVHYDQTLTPSTLSTLVNSLPNDGRKLEIKLSWLISGVWDSVVSTNKAYDIHCLIGGGIFESYYVQDLNTTGANDNISYYGSYFHIGGYNYYVDSRAVVNEGATFTVNITTSAASKCARLKLWIDWNEDGDFDDEREEIYSAGVFEKCTNPVDYNILINVPTGSIGTKRMRIQLRDAWLPEPTSCGINNHTASADFDIEVIESNNIPSTVYITSPVNNTNYSSLQQIVIDAYATDSDAYITQLEFFVDGNSVGIDTSCPYNINWTIPSWGSYQLTAKSTNNQSVEIVSTAVSISATDPNGSRSNSKGNLLGREIKVYPNPLKNSGLYISSKVFINKRVSVQLFSITGHTVLSTKKTFKQNEKIELSVLPKGLYFLKLKSNNNHFIKKVIIDN